MSEHVALTIDPPATEARGRAPLAAKKFPPSPNKISPQRSSSSLVSMAATAKDAQRGEDVSVAHPEPHIRNHDDSDSMPSLGTAECRICQEEDLISNLESPCDCSGSLKFAHRKCVQHWCTEKGDTTCEICLKPYEGGYIAPPPTSRINSFAINIGNSWEIASGQRLDLHEPRIFTVTSEQLYAESEYDEYARANERSAACFRSVALILMLLLLMRHILSMTSSSGAAEEETLTFFVLFVLRTALFFLPCYIMARALNILQNRRRQAIAAAEVAYILQSGQGQGVHIAVSPGLSV